MLRRRRNEDEEQAWAQAAGDSPDEPENGSLDNPDEPEGSGPWDANDDVPEAERIDFGSIRVPVREGLEVQVSMADDQPAWVTVVHGDSGLQLQAFAAPKTGGLWADVREEIAAEVTKAGGESAEADGPFGVEVRAHIAPPGRLARTWRPAGSRSGSWASTARAGSCAG